MDEQTYQRMRAMAMEPGGMAEIERGLYRAIYENLRDSLRQAREEIEEAERIRRIGDRVIADRDRELLLLRDQVIALGGVPQRTSADWFDDPP